MNQAREVWPSAGKPDEGDSKTSGTLYKTARGRMGCSRRALERGSADSLLLGASTPDAIRDSIDQA